MSKINYYDDKKLTLDKVEQLHAHIIETDEIIPIDSIKKIAYGQKEFWKIYLFDFLTILKIGVNTSACDILCYILEHTRQDDNYFYGTQEKIAKDLNLSKIYVYRTLKKFQEINFITKHNLGVWQINPNILCKGNVSKQGLLIQYYQESKTKNDDQTIKAENEQIQYLQNTIEECTQAINEIKKIRLRRQQENKDRQQKLFEDLKRVGE